MNYIKISNSKVNKDLYNFVNNEVIPGTDIEANDFWQKFIESCNLLSIENEELINERLQIQSKIDDWLKDNRFKDFSGRNLCRNSDRVMICGSLAMLNSHKEICEKLGMKEGSNSDPGEYVIEKAFVD